MKRNNIKHMVSAFFKDNEGDVVVWQMPNIPLLGWLLFKLLSLITHPGLVKNGFEGFSMAFLFTWAYLEITSGKSYFRRALGVVIAVALIFSYFKQN